MNVSQSVTLPPISSFDSLVRAAEHEHFVRVQHGQRQRESALGAPGVGLSVGGATHALGAPSAPSAPSVASVASVGSVGSFGPVLVGAWSSGSDTTAVAATHNSFIASGSGAYGRADSRGEGGAGTRVVPGTTATAGTRRDAAPSFAGTLTRHEYGGRASVSAPEPRPGVAPVSPDTNGSGGAAAGPAPRAAKPRRKKQCPVCHNFYANLSTHKSSHMLPEHKPHKCPVCARGFTRNNDLLRHRKRHWKDEIIGAGPGIGAAGAGAGATATATASGTRGEDDAPGVSPGASSSVSSGSAGLGGAGGADAADRAAGEPLSPQQQLRSLHQIKGTFHCPYKSALIALDMDTYPGKRRELAFETSECHQTGVFSRCDTFKNHLKALHFEYPPGTKKKDRSSVPGRCKQCGRHFANVGEWLSSHVGKDCGYVYH